MQIYKRGTRKTDIGPLKGVLVFGPEGMTTRLRRNMKTVCKACGKSLVEGDSLCCGFPEKAGVGNLILHEKCLDDQARSVIHARRS